MAQQLWHAETQILAHIFLIQQDNIQSIELPHPSVRKFILEPILDDNKKQTEKFNMAFDFEMNSEGDIESNVVADIGRDILKYFVNMITFISRNPVRIIMDPSYTYNIPGTKKTRLIKVASEVKFFEPPVPLLNTKLFTNKMDPKHSRILAWLCKGLEEQDSVNSIYSLFVSLELLANQFTCSKIIRECKKCGYKSEIEPGMKQKIENLLINELSYPRDKCEELWKSRNELSHGGISLSTDDSRKLASIKQDLYIAIISGIKKILGLAPAEPPRELPPPFGFIDAILDIVYESKTDELSSQD